MIDVFLVEYDDSGVSFTPRQAMWPPCHPPSPTIGLDEYKPRPSGRCTDSIYRKYFAAYKTAAYIDGPVL